MGAARVKVRYILAFPVPCGVAFLWCEGARRARLQIPAYIVSSFVYELLELRLGFYKGGVGLEDYANMSVFSKQISDTKENIVIDSGTEDELSAPSKLFRVTPRNSVAGQANPIGLDPTSYANVSNIRLYLTSDC